MAQVVDADADIIEYKLASNLSNGVHELYSIHFVNGRKTEFRKCLRCSAVVKAPKSGTSALHEHKDISSKRKIALQNQSPLPFKKTKIMVFHYTFLIFYYKALLSFILKCFVNKENYIPFFSMYFIGFTVKMFRSHILATMNISCVRVNSVDNSGHGKKFERISSNFNFEWAKFEFSKNRNKFESLCSNFELSI